MAPTHQHQPLQQVEDVPDEPRQQATPDQLVQAMVTRISQQIEQLIDAVDNQSQVDTVETRLNQRIDQLNNVVVGQQLLQDLVDLEDRFRHQIDRFGRVVGQLASELNSHVNALDRKEPRDRAQGVQPGHSRGFDQQLDVDREHERHGVSRPPPNVGSHLTNAAFSPATPATRQQTKAQTTAASARVAVVDDLNDKRSFEEKTHHQVGGQPVAAHEDDASDHDDDSSVEFELEFDGEEPQTTPRAKLQRTNRLGLTLLLGVESLTQPCAKRQRLEYQKHATMANTKQLNALQHSIPLGPFRAMAHILLDADDSSLAVAATFVAMEQCYSHTRHKTRRSTSTSTLAGLVPFLERKPWQVVRAQMPQRTHCVDTNHSPTDPRVDQLERTVDLLRNRFFQSLWERTHWIVFPLFQAIKSPWEWDEYCSQRQTRANNLHQVMTQLYQQALPLIQAKLVDPALLVEPGLPWYPKTTCLWTPTSTNWMNSVKKLDAQEPWRIWWWTVPDEHPHNTILCARRRKPKHPVL